MSEQAPQRTAGWYVGVGLFWLITAWLITAGLSSITPQIFWPAPAADSAAAACAPELRRLRGELLARWSASISATGDRAALEGWLKAWDQRLGAALGACQSPEERSAHRELARLRHGLWGLIERFDKEQAPHIRKMDKLLGDPPKGAAARPHLSPATPDALVTRWRGNHGGQRPPQDTL